MLDAPLTHAELVTFAQRLLAVAFVSGFFGSWLGRVFVAGVGALQEWGQRSTRVAVARARAEGYGARPHVQPDPRSVPLAVPPDVLARLSPASSEPPCDSCGVGAADLAERPIAAPGAQAPEASTRALEDGSPAAGAAGAL